MFIFLFRAAMIVIAVILIIAGCVDQYGESRKSKKAALLGIIPLAVFLLYMYQATMLVSDGLRLVEHLTKH